MDRHLIMFGRNQERPIHAEAALHGLKGANLLRMAMAEIPLPAGAVLPTPIVDRFFRDPEETGVWLGRSVDQMITRLKLKPESLVALRTSPVQAQPGLKPTLLGLGVDDRVTAAQTERYGRDYALRKRADAIMLYGEIVSGIDAIDFEEAIEAAEDEHGPDAAHRLASVEAVYRRHAGTDFTVSRGQQIADCIAVMIRDWQAPKARTYRTLNGLPEVGGLAIVLQEQILFDAAADGLSGTASTRMADDGRKLVNGTYRSSGGRSRLPISDEQPDAVPNEARSLAQCAPDIYGALSGLADRLETTFSDAQTFEFVHDGSDLFAMSSETSRLAIKPVLSVMIDLVGRGVATQEQALLRIDPLALESLIHRTIDPSAARDVIGSGLAASPGAASGVIAFSAGEAAAIRESGRAPILVRIETSPEDVVGMAAAEGVVTARGGLTSHAAVVARGMGKPCITGLAALRIDTARQEAHIGKRVLRSGDVITIDGTLGEIMAGSVPTVMPEISDNFATLLSWADRFRRLGVRANADTVEEAETAKRFGAAGIGLCRTEHMFFRADRVNEMRDMILAANEEDRRAALARLGPMQRSDFEAMFAIMAGMPVTLRLLDPPLHEFLPSRESEFAETAARLGADVESIKARVEALRETNPMLGHRGCRLAISHPEILDMQSRAIFEAAMNAEDRTGRKISPEIMIPFVCAAEEVRIIRARIEAMAQVIEKERGRLPSFTVGTMIELPRAALGADRIAAECTFFSFGTNDLTQTTFGISRDDASPFMALYRERHVLQDDPFQKFDVIGAGEMMRLACDKGRRARRELTLGVCGEHGGEPDSIAFFDTLGIDYISCSPYRVPIARLAAAQAAIRRRSFV